MKVLVKFRFISTILGKMMPLKSRHMKVLKYASFVKLQNELFYYFIYFLSQYSKLPRYLHKA